METSDGYLPIEKIACHAGTKVKVLGIVRQVRNQGGLVFIDIEEGKNIVQALVIPDNTYAYAMSQRILRGYLIEIKGMIKDCPASIQDSSEPQKVEIDVKKISIISARNEKQNRSRVTQENVGKVAEKRRKRIV